MNLKIVDGCYQVIKLRPSDEVPDNVFCGAFCSATKTDEEISIVTDSDIEMESDAVEKNWKIIKIDEILDFSLMVLVFRLDWIG